VRLKSQEIPDFLLFETPSLPQLRRRYRSGFASYLGSPISSIPGFVIQISENFC
jgi:hypothetical protein